MKVLACGYSPDLQRTGSHRGREVAISSRKAEKRAGRGARHEKAFCLSQKE
jgi:hypothetical protein